MSVSAYRAIAKNALMSWNGLSEKEAKKVVLNSTFDQLENNIGAKNTIKYAVEAISAFLEMDEKEKKELEVAVLGQDDPQMTEQQEKVLNQISDKAKNVDVNTLALYALKCIHDGWVIDNIKKFNQEGRENKKFQHLPLEMIGWKEAKADLLFLEPILNSIGKSIDENKLIVEYHRDAEVFFKKNGFINENLDLQPDKIADAILKGKDFYPALTDENTAKTKDEAEKMAGQVYDKVGMSRDYEGKLRTI